MASSSSNREASVFTLASDYLKSPEELPSLYVTFIVGTKDIQQPFRLQRSVVCTISPVLNEIFKDFTEILRIEDVEKEVFEYLSVWVTTGQHQSVHDESRKLLGGRAAPVGFPAPVTLVKVWRLGERFRIPEFQNNTMRLLYAVLDITASQNTIISVVEFAWHDREPDMLKSLFVNKFAYCWWSGYVRELLPHLPSTMVFAIVDQLKRGGEAKRDIRDLRKSVEAFFVK
ncbi:uncharacterized protein L3040_003827 [Drepanopeziza brunnea f. sp. 'multigermtubi']|uniref:BTB domain-containing protein n=1 Tax=Marssonina brunnea f. sp. multigermtubi (strain MB_m1) TaxID=1072389 RepID=K1WPR4_MARBU|nr:uncharacterized protein MBM_06737 [Drepanopeziza brunnea f. sp. 'multigermtubi' MB_m1]EKD14976.1 hypothetical protein MBM_06737 [Drepanopeziza brunnea f. sp. 'multigermtubi' MB_m1]KAJ5046588.1 hypothetical protein L3040_003827 [Drepanopeziza brunnea f. sp. 'multigermtubi']